MTGTDHSDNTHVAGYETLEESPSLHDIRIFQKTPTETWKLLKELKESLLSKSDDNVQVDEKIRQTVERFRTSGIDIGVTGGDCKGKTRLIRALTDSPTPQEGPSRSSRFKNVNFWKYNCTLQEVRRCTTGERRKESYETEPLRVFDALIITSAGRFSETDSELAKLAQHYRIPAYFVRTKVDQDIENEKRDREDDFDETSLLEILRKDASTNLALAGLPQCPIFVVSSLPQHAQDWEFPELLRELEESTPRKNLARFLSEMEELSRVVVYDVRVSQRKNINTLATRILESGKEEEKHFDEVCQVLIKDYGSVLPEDDHKQIREKCFDKSTQVEQHEQARATRRCCLAMPTWGNCQKVSSDEQTAAFNQLTDVLEQSIGKLEENAAANLRQLIQKHQPG